MNFDLDDDQLALREHVRAFTAREIAPHAHHWWETEQFPSEAFRKMGAAGLMGLLVPEKYGGTNAGHIALALTIENIGTIDQSTASSLNAHLTIGSLALVHFGSDAQRRRWLVPLASGEKLGAFALTEPEAGSDAASVRTRAIRDGSGWRINGTKIFISNAGTDMSAGVTLLARTGEMNGRGLFSAFYIPEGTEGYLKSNPLRKLGWHSMDTRELSFRDCWVSDEHLIGDEGLGLNQFLDVLDSGRVSVAALGLGLAQGALDLALEYCSQRRQFGQTIGEFQAVRHKLADMATEVEAGRGMVYRAAWLADQKRPFKREAAMAKLYTSELANRVAAAALQLHGGTGYMRESAIARFYADAKVLEIGEGTSEIQRNVIAKELMKR